MLGSLLPSSVITAEAFADEEEEPCFPGEEDLIATAVASRRREFVTARRCAREALVALGFDPAPIRRGPRREPIWPAGVAGSLTHCAGFRGAAVARIEDMAGIGVDAEPHAPLPPRVLGVVTADGEVDHLAALSAEDPSVHWDRLLFSAKESVYKAWFPLTQRWLGFEDAALRIDPVRRTFAARILVESPWETLHGRYLIGNGLVVTAVCIDRHPGAGPWTGPAGQS
ncbi:4'-phosphopantetheinyl transferase superfamily protein [Actinoplanes sp. NEAU-A12]|uniref:4'-phosphopantetheinyl transferase superfamily protein n=1 Tax=Actinoplanes sandaracinus TaxID=3045177 RepID=A0ABT6WNN5_9ACTN|nr:4'-phosphopantetheinyl transferase superfamily protein [Actinoplanes sandaracinus]MDI6101355.1 4'-phosphopantetheinyl transferase superfamily protein [Actinoplanes sandaracinus]